MNAARRKRIQCIKHREQQYEKALDGIIEGKLPPSYAQTRWQKLKEIKNI